MPLDSSVSTLTTPVQYVAATSRDPKLVSSDTDFDRADIERWAPADVLDQLG